MIEINKKIYSENDIKFMLVGFMVLCILACIASYNAGYNEIPKETSEHIYNLTHEVIKYKDYYEFYESLVQSCDEELIVLREDNKELEDLYTYWYNRKMSEDRECSETIILEDVDKCNAYYNVSKGGFFPDDCQAIFTYASLKENSEYLKYNGEQE